MGTKPILESLLKIKIKITGEIDLNKIFNYYKEKKNLKKLVNDFSIDEKQMLYKFSNTSDGILFFQDDKEFYENYSEVLKKLQMKGIIFHNFEEFLQRNYFYLADIKFLEKLKRMKEIGYIKENF